MFRVTSGMLKDTMLYNLQTAHRKMDRVQNQVATGKKASMPHQDPSGVINSMLFKSRLTELKQFQHNATDADSRLKFYDTALESVGNIMLRLKELSVQASNGSYNDHDRKIAASEVDQLLKQLVDIGNTQYKNETIFSGFKIEQKPFRVFMEKVPGSASALINKVEYTGDIGIQQREIEQQQYTGINLIGNKVFWGNNMRISSSSPGTNYKAVKDQVFRLDGIAINVKAGDTLPVIVQKINAANLPIHASIDNTKGANLLVLESTDPHQIWIEDIKGGSVMQDLGLIARGSNTPPKNYSPTARVHANSMFDQVINFRNALLKNDLKALGSKHMGNIDMAIKQITSYRGKVGALTNRLEAVRKRLATDQVNITDVLSKTEDVDMSESITNLKMLEYVRQAAMQVGARVLPKTLLDFLR